MPPSRAAVLVCDDEPLIRDTLAEFLAQEGFAVEAVGSGEEAARRAADRFFDVVLCDVNLPGIDGIETLHRVLAVSPESFVLLITAYGTVESAVEAFQRGAQDYLMKPILLDEVLGKIRRLLKLRDLSRENQWLRRELHQAQPAGRGRRPEPGHGPGCTSWPAEVAPTRSTVLIQGESGTGKEVLARFIHEQVRRRAIPGRELSPPSRTTCWRTSCSATARGRSPGPTATRPGVFVHAGDGTVFLDEIAELPLATQAKLLRAIEQKEVMPVGANEPVKVEARILAATNKSWRPRSRPAGSARTSSTG